MKQIDKNQHYYAVVGLTDKSPCGDVRKHYESLPDCKCEEKEKELLKLRKVVNEIICLAPYEDIHEAWNIIDKQLTEVEMKHRIKIFTNKSDVNDKKHKEI